MQRKKKKRCLYLKAVLVLCSQSVKLSIIFVCFCDRSVLIFCQEWLLWFSMFCWNKLSACIFLFYFTFMRTGTVICTRVLFTGAICWDFLCGQCVLCSVSLIWDSDSVLIVASRWARCFANTCSLCLNQFLSSVFWPAGLRIVYVFLFAWVWRMPVLLLHT